MIGSKVAVVDEHRMPGCCLSEMPNGTSDQERGDCKPKALWDTGVMLGVTLSRRQDAHVPVTITAEENRPPALALARLNQNAEVRREAVNPCDEKVSLRGGCIGHVRVNLQSVSETKDAVVDR